MNPAAFANFVRHLLFLFIILKFINGIILFLQTQTCRNTFDEQELLPFTLDNEVYAPLYMSIDFLFILITSIGYLLIIMSLVAFYGAITLHYHQLVNFAAGMAFLLMVPAEIVGTVVLDDMLDTFTGIVIEGAEALFDSSNGFLESLRTDNPDQFASFFEPIHYNDFGWSQIARGDDKNHSYIDHIQIVLKCCGTTGRAYWEMALPWSCCEEKYVKENCTLMVAYYKGCNYDYNLFRICITGLKFEFFFFSLLSLATAISSIYLARLKILYPDEDYRSEYSSSTSDDDH